MFLWFPPSRGFHLPMISTFPWFPLSCGFHPPVVSTFPWLLCGFHLSMVSTLCGYFVVCTLLSFASLCGFHPPVVTPGVPSVVCTSVVYTLLWFPPSRGFHLCMVPTLLWLLHGVPSMVCTIMWFTLCHGFHPLMVTPWCLSWILA